MQQLVEHGIHVVDSGFVRPRLDAIHLIEEGGRVAIVDTGVNESVPRVLDALAGLGLGPENVDWIVLTHVHLDHAGGAGELMRLMPAARLLVHPRGVRHMIDPSRLIAGTIEVYGAEAAHRMYGEILPVPAQRVVEAPDGAAIELNGRRLEVLDTPGHASHHLCLFDTRARVVFTGDTFGLSYRELDVGDCQFVVPTTTPIQFDPPALHRSIDRIVALQARAACLTHYGPVSDVERLADDLHRQIDALVVLGKTCACRFEGAAVDTLDEGPGSLRRCLRDGVRDLILAEGRRQGWAGGEDDWLRIFDLDIRLNGDGLAAWLARTERIGPQPLVAAPSEAGRKAASMPTKTFGEPATSCSENR
ncbi:MAG TPA: MBL fold metallo-hydrolase [Burkholderiaceae bacterium]|nr:MBL fold metallo-hydrolase [Burkholderiaceae bacterium]